MQNTRYQIFISSTYEDLKDERAQLIATILSMNGIPAGMEFFPAMDEEQFNHIKKIIDYSDYFVLILGGRYGTVSASGQSYTEREYDYAVEREIPVMAFLVKNPDQLPRNKTDTDETLFKKQELFRDKVSKNRLIQYWENPNTLATNFAIGFHSFIEQFPRPGWVRGDIRKKEIIDNLSSLKDIIGEILGIHNVSLPKGQHIPLVLSTETEMDLRPFVKQGFIELRNLGGLIMMGAGNQSGNFIEEKKNPAGMGSCYELIINTDI